GVGDDANPCSRTAPCKTFAGAISKTAQGGEIDCLDPGGFGAVTITKSITLDCDTGTGSGSIVVSGTSGIVIQAATTDVLNLRNRGLNGLAQSGNAGVTGIRVLSAKAVHLHDVTVFNFATSCVSAELGSTSLQLTIEDSSLSECGANGGVFVQTGAVSA